jgi:ribonucleotide monophosphatase NagD (HAD superfamily)
MIGDNSIADVEGANFVGLDTILLKKGKLSKISKEDYARPNFVIKNLKDLIKIVSQ